MKTLSYYLFLAVFFCSTSAYAIDRLVSNLSDEGEDEGTLRKILRDACNESGNDVIGFSQITRAELRIHLKTPLVIPNDCNGKITLEGSDEAETIIDGSALTGPQNQPGDSCSFHVYSDGHKIKNITFVGNSAGAGICLFGNDNTIESNAFGITQKGTAEPNLHGVVISDAFIDYYDGEIGSGNQVISNTIEANEEYGLWVHAASMTLADNTIASNGADGVWLDGNAAIISGNSILANGGCPDEPLLASQLEDCTNGIGGAGISIQEGSSDILIGGESFDSDKNIIQYNRDGGILVFGEHATNHIQITHNIISLNYDLGIDLGSDGVTANDVDDADSGPNKLLNFADHLQAFPLVPSTSNGAARYWAWGAAKTGDKIETYGVADEDVERNVENGGANTFISDTVFASYATTSGMVAIPIFSNVDTFSIDPAQIDPNTIAGLTALSFDKYGNTSEFAMNARIGADRDLDGILDELETGDGTPNATSSDPNNPDTDGDGLADSVEDKNRNGIWEPELGETCSYKSDSDGDGMPDGFEVHEDDSYAPTVDTNPLESDSDGDGINDGDEDKNRNGIWEIYLGETNPLLTDTDADGFPDGADNCPTVYNSGQEAWYCGH
jgi:hypothetical protein